MSQADIELIRQLRVTLSFLSSYSHLQSAEITSLHQHAWFMQCWGKNPRLHAC